MARLVKLGRCKNVVVVAGAGISTASGIPDFRSDHLGAVLALHEHFYRSHIIFVSFFLCVSKSPDAGVVPLFSRTPGTGLYANLERYNIPYPEAVFNIDYFSNNPQPFFSLAKALYPGSHRPNYIHYFIRMLHHKGLLLRMYTQNIDGLEKRERASGRPACSSAPPSKR